jgi:hypothetical protein
MEHPTCYSCYIPHPKDGACSFRLCLIVGDVMSPAFIFHGFRYSTKPKPLHRSSSEVIEFCCEKARDRKILPKFVLWHHNLYLEWGNWSTFNWLTDWLIKVTIVLNLSEQLIVNQLFKRFPVV